MKIIRARLKPMSGSSEFISIQGKIKSILTKYVGDNFDFVVDDEGRKFVKSFGVDFIDQELVGKIVPLVNDRVNIKFKENGTIEVIDNIDVRESNKEGKYILRFDQFNEGSLPRESTIRQLKRLRKISKSTDIGDRVPNMKKQGANIHFMHNPIDTGIESYEDFEKHNKKFKPGWNARGETSPFKE